MHQSTSFSHQKSKNFLGRGTAPSPDPFPVGRGRPPIPHLSSAPTTTRSWLRHWMGVGVNRAAKRSPYGRKQPNPRPIDCESSMGKLQFTIHYCPRLYSLTKCSAANICVIEIQVFLCCGIMLTTITLRVLFDCILQHVRV